MEPLNLEMINAGPILTDLQSRIQTFHVSGTVYLSPSRVNNAGNPSVTALGMDAFGIGEFILPELLQILGIRSLTLSRQHDLTPLANLPIVMTNVASERFLWHYLRNDVVIGELRALFRHCRTIAFDNWSSLIGASDLWNGLLIDVIKPIEKKDVEFIFYLGDPLTKLSFQVDEALDIISDFSLYGQVTFALDEEEASKLWMVLNGVRADTPVAHQIAPDLNRKYLSIFRTMKVTRLLIYSATNAVLFAKQQQFVLARRKVAQTTEMAMNARQNFIAGFSIGLLLQLNMAHCLALGLVVFEILGQHKVHLNKENLLEYIDQWINDLQKPETIYLYQ
jgi:hypothetical protein